MDKKKALVIGIIVGLSLIGVGALAYTNSQNKEEKAAEVLAMEKKSEDEAMIKKEETAAMEKDAMVKDGESMEKNEVMSKHGSYVTLEDYNNNSSKYADSKKVYFFHASWCPICQGIDKEINADTTKIPAGVTLIKTDFDDATDLRKKYGVTTQYTFVQVDNSGNETAQWSATSLDSAINGIN